MLTFQMLIPMLTFSEFMLIIRIDSYRYSHRIRILFLLFYCGGKLLDEFIKILPIPSKNFPTVGSPPNFENK
jgi:hypothetical protein